MTDDLWAAPHARRRLDASVSLPGSKSLTNRALVLAALADGPSRITRPLVARDTELMAAALRAMGTTVEESADTWTVTPAPLKGPAEVDCGLAGTVMRFVPPVAGLARGPVRFDGDAYARTRPLGMVLTALDTLGVTVRDEGRGTLPFTIEGDGAPRGGLVRIDASASSQFVSGLLLAGARYSDGVDVRHDGKPVPSVPHIDMTVAMLRARGVQVDASEPNRWVVLPSPIRAVDTTVEPDLSNAGPFVAAALVAGGRVRIRDWPEVTDQPGDAWRAILTVMGASVGREGTDLVVEAEPEAIEPVVLDLHDVGELTPVVAALAALGRGRSVLSGIAHLRGHETDRLAALATELAKVGADVEVTADGLAIAPGPRQPAELETYADHRMAQAAAVIGLAVPGVRVRDIATTTKTFPGFAEAWTAAVG